MLRKEFSEFVIRVTEEVGKKFLKEEWEYAKAEIESMVKERLGDEYDLSLPDVFDAFSYCQFKVIGSRIGNPDVMNTSFTKEIGRRIYEMASESMRLTKPSGPDDIEGLKAMLGELTKFFEDVGYVSKGEIRWSIFDIDSWRQRGEAKLIYKMVDPVILPSAQRLYSEGGYAQHFSSRTIEHALSLLGIEGREVKDFDPRDYGMEDVEELWELRKAKPKSGGD